MKFIRRYNLKKVLITCFSVVILFLLINVIISNYFYKEYYLESNAYISYLLGKIESKYPSVNQEVLIKELNKDIKSDRSILDKYGVELDSTSALKVYETIHQKEIIVTSISILLLGLILILIYLIDSYFKNKELRCITRTIKKVNAGDYRLDLNENYEGDLSILKDEIYKTTLMLREKAEESIAGKNNLKDSIANISHQIKTPLTSILIMVDNIIEEDVDKETQKEFLKDIRMQIENMNFLIVALLKLSRFDANVIEFKKEKINVIDLLKDVNKNVAIMAEIKNINIQITGDEATTFVGDYHWEIEALTNIIKNCVEHTGENKNIYIHYTDSPFYTKLVIQDEGKGMSKEEQRRIFERFYKGKNSSSNSIGIGLALAKEIIEKDNGIIRVKSKEKEGTIFTIKYFKSNK